MVFASTGGGRVNYSSRPELFGSAIDLGVVPQVSASTGDLRTTIVKALAVFTGDQASAGKLFDQAMSAIQEEAGQGASSAVRPYVIGTAVIATIALGLAAYAVLK